MDKKYFKTIISMDIKESQEIYDNLNDIFKNTNNSVFRIYYIKGNFIEFTENKEPTLFKCCNDIKEIKEKFILEKEALNIIINRGYITGSEDDFYYCCLD